MSKKRRDAQHRRVGKVSSRSSSVLTRTALEAAPRSIADDGVWQALRSPLRLQVLEAIRAAPGIDARTLASALKTSTPRLYYHINILLESGLIVGMDGTSAATRRTASRGPEALAYRASTNNFPDGFFTAGERSQRRRELLLRELFESGMGLALASQASSSAHLSVRREHLTPAEGARVQALLAEVEGILDGARARRHGGSLIVPATHFVGCAFCETDGDLPDGPLGRR